MKESYLQFRKDFSTQLEELTVVELEETYAALLLDHPEIFWMDNYIAVPQVNDTKICTNKSIQLKYYYTEEEAIAIKARIEPVYMEIVNGAKKQKNDYKKINSTHTKKEVKSNERYRHCTTN